MKTMIAMALVAATLGACASVEEQAFADKDAIMAEVCRIKAANGTMTPDWAYSCGAYR